MGSILVGEIGRKRREHFGTVIDITTQCGVTFAWRWCPGGSATLGSPATEEGRFEDEEQHRFTTSGFWLLDAPVTQAQYRAVTGQSPSFYVGDDRPVERVTWHEAVAAAKAIGALNDVAVWNRTPVQGTATVRSKAPNAFGLYDMLGNVWEWTESAKGSFRVFRGGAWFSDARSVRAAVRLAYSPGDRGHGLGFRLARGSAVDGPPECQRYFGRSVVVRCVDGNTRQDHMTPNIPKALRAIADLYTPEVCAAVPKPDGLTIRHAANLLRKYAASIEADPGATDIYAAKIRGVRWSTLDSDAARLWGEAVALFGPDPDAHRRNVEPVPVLGRPARKDGPPEWLEHLVTGAFRQGFAAGVAAEQARAAGAVLPSPPCPSPSDPSSTESNTQHPSASSDSPAP